MFLSSDHVQSSASQLPQHTPHDPTRARVDCIPSELHNPVEKESGSLESTQWIERKLAEYNASQNISKRWLFEVLSWYVSALSMAAIVGIYIHLKDQPISSSRLAVLFTLANVLRKGASAALFVPTTEALGQLKWNWFHISKAM
jgi:hypothetical protein